MNKPQFITSPAGEEMVVLPKAEYLSLIEAAEDASDIAAARRGLKSLLNEGTVPAEITSATLSGIHPIVAWRDYRGLTQAQLANKAGLTQAAIARIEAAPPGAGRKATKIAIATALDAPLWSIGDHTVF